MGKKVLVVDDSVTVRQQVSSALSRAGFEVLEAADGRQGLNVIASTQDLKLVVSDVNMPHMDGLEMLERMRASDTNASVPVVMLTTEGQRDLIARAKQAGAKGWIVKPFKADLLIAAAKKLTG